MIKEGTLFYPPNYLDLQEPKPCPFCGSEKIYLEKIEVSAGEIWGATCASCGAEMLDARTHTAAEAFTLWNKRATKND